MFSDTSTCNAYLSGIVGTTNFLALGTTTQGNYYNTAYELIINNPRYNIDTTDTSANLYKAQAQLAVSIYSDPSSQKRSELISQGVTAFTVMNFSETYKSDADGGFPLAVAGLLYAWRKAGARITVLDRC